MSLTRYYADLPLHLSDADTRAGCAGSGYVSDFSVEVYTADEVRAVLTETVEVLRLIEQEWNNRGEQTSLHAWHGRMKNAMAVTRNFLTRVQEIAL